MRIHKMDTKTTLVCCVVAFLGLLSAFLGFIAEGKRIKGSDVKISSETDCAYPRSPALALGFTAALCLLIAMAILNVASGCLCGPRPPYQSNYNRALGLLCFIFCWLAFVLAFLLFLSAAALNDYQNGDQTIYFGNYNCYVVKPGVFNGAATMSIASTVFGLFYYLCFTTAKETVPVANQAQAQAQAQAGIVMGQPQAQQQAAQGQGQGPVFVHEDTYARRQLP